MKKIVRQQNYLKELIESQGNQVLTKTALRCIQRAILEPLIDNPEEGVVLHRLIDKSGIAGLLKRLEFSSVKGYDFSDESENLKEKVWANTEFLAVLTHRFVAIIVWDSKTDNPNYVRYYSIINSKLQSEVLDIIDRNTNINIKEFAEKFKPDRRDNILLNNSIHKLIENMDEATKEAVLGFAQIQSEKEDVEINKNIREIAHEIKNQLSICDLYSDILRKTCMKAGIDNESIFNAIKCINRAVQYANNSLVELKSSEKVTMKLTKLQPLLEEAYNLTKVYCEGKNIEYIMENDIDINVPVDDNKFISVIINMVKNASEAFSTDENNVQDGKYIKIKTETDENFVLIRISNNAGKIEFPGKVFNEGYTTKSNGSGIGLSVCKKTIESMYGKLSLEHTNTDYTEFLIRLGKVE